VQLEAGKIPQWPDKLVFHNYGQLLQIEAFDQDPCTDDYLGKGEIDIK
jgi:hypothetical protein